MSTPKPLFNDYLGDLETKILILIQQDPILQPEDYRNFLLDVLIAVAFRFHALEDGTPFNHKNI